MKSLKLYLVAIVCATILLATSGCIVIPLAVAGYAVAKVTVANTKGKTIVTFAKPAIADTNALLAVKSIAVWPKAMPGVVADASLAEQLSPTFKVVTPMAVTQALGTTVAAQSLDEMTATEQKEAFRLVSDKTGADAVLSAVGMNEQTDLATFKLSHASTTRSFTLLIYSRSKDAIIWQDTFSTKVGMGANQESVGEMQEEATKELVGQILEITGHAPPPAPEAKPKSGK